MCTTIDLWNSNDTLSNSRTSTTTVNPLKFRGLDHITPKLLCVVLTKAVKKIENFNSIRLTFSCKQFCICHMGLYS